jgi:hypothetical protein
MNRLQNCHSAYRDHLYARPAPSQSRHIMTVDSLAAAFQHFNITHVTASEFFGFIAHAGDGCEGQPAAVRGAMIPVCMSQPHRPIDISR